MPSVRNSFMAALSGTLRSRRKVDSPTSIQSEEMLSHEYTQVNQPDDFWVNNHGVPHVL